ncbi:MAG: ADP-ribosylglycohydrolase family protein [Thermomicrobiales bacterium]|nr:ADP-ribosylglycohydrolase family protein [Thermomicrobiales bacterium]
MIGRLAVDVVGTPDWGYLVIERYRGCLLGLACGDALGGPVEFQTRQQISSAFPSGLRDFVGGGWLHLAPGEITDDTQMTLALARSLAQDGPLDMNDVGIRFLDWYRSEPKDIGNTTRAALQLLADGETWERAGERAMRESRSAAGNGSVMRCAPVALRFRRDPAAMIAASIDSARITHADPRCTAGAVAVNQAIVHLLQGGAIAEVAEAAVAGIDESETRKAVLGAATLAEPDVPNSGYVLSTVTAAFWALANHDSLEETIVAAVALGGDADTAGAVAGALAGACYGAGAIPERWLTLLQPRDELESLAERLFALSESS